MSERLLSPDLALLFENACVAASPAEGLPSITTPPPESRGESPTEALPDATEPLLTAESQTETLPDGAVHPPPVQPQLFASPAVQQQSNARRPPFTLSPEHQPVAEKVRYVRSQGQTRDHHCHWPGCGKQVPPALWGCRPHWYRLPKALRDRIWRAYQPGQEIAMLPSREYLQVANDVQQWIRDNT